MARRDIRDDRRRGRFDAAGTALLHALVGFGLYLVFAGQLSRHELITGAVLALAVAGWAVALRACCSARLAVNTDHIRRWLQAIVGLAGATIRTGGALLAVIAKRASPRTDVSSFVHGPADEPGANGRRATAVLAASLAPDSFVVRTPADENRVLIHRLAPTQRTPDPLWLA